MGGGNNSHGQDQISGRRWAGSEARTAAGHPVRHSAGETIKRIWIPQIIACGMLLWALNPNNPYVYYIFLRWVCCGIFGFLAFRTFARDMQGLTWMLGITALVYNPIFRVHLTREIWSVVNVVTVVIAIVSIFLLPNK